MVNCRYIWLFWNPFLCHISGVLCFSPSSGSNLGHSELQNPQSLKINNLVAFLVLTIVHAFGNDIPGWMEWINQNP